MSNCAARAHARGSHFGCPQMAKPSASGERDAAPALTQFMDALSVMYKKQPLEAVEPCYQQNSLIIFGATSTVTFTVSQRRPGVRLPGMRRASVVHDRKTSIQLSEGLGSESKRSPSLEPREVGLPPPAP